MQLPIKDYLLIGDLHTAALVSTKGSIDWMCLPSFDSPSVFAAILDPGKGGTFSIDAEGWTTRSAYVPYTAVVETEFEKGGSAFTVRDCMLPRPTEEAVPHYLNRRFRGKKGEAEIRLIFDPRPNYARQRSIVHVEKQHCSIRIDEHELSLHFPKDAVVTHRAEKHGVEIRFTIREGETKDVVLEHAVSSRLRLRDTDIEQETIDFWKNWITQGMFEFSREHLVRSAITLKLMQFYPTGGIIAAPTTSLPEELGGIRNWDYRFVWVRDATFTLYAYYVLGFKEEARKFFRYIETIAEDAKQCEGDVCDLNLSVMYTIWGQPLQGESVLEHLSGYDNSPPVRIGNGAAEQFQLDVYGSLIDAYYFMSKRDLPISPQGRDIIRMLVRGISVNWQRTDSGIWEVRGGDRHFTYSKMMAWLGVDRALRLKEELKLTAQEEKTWTALRDAIKTWIWENCYDAKRGTFRQHPETEAQDATNFVFVLLQFLDRHDPRTKSVIEETRKELSYKDLHIYRYKVDDGLKGGEGAFILCMYWQIAALAAVGELDEAEALFRKFESCIPPSGLIAEEIDPDTGAYLGNFPQAFSHIGYILSAYYIDRYSRKHQD